MAVEQPHAAGALLDGGDRLPISQADAEQQPRKIAHVTVERGAGRPLAGHARTQQRALEPGADRHEAAQRNRQLQQPTLAGRRHAACARGARKVAKPQSSHSVKVSMSAVSTVAPHQTRRPGGASR